MSIAPDLPANAESNREAISGWFSLVTSMLVYFLGMGDFGLAIIHISVVSSSSSTSRKEG